MQFMKTALVHRCFQLRKKFCFPIVLKMGMIGQTQIFELAKDTSSNCC